ncbi:unnamed protein product [Prorocentrum cordatum]|uniref:Uncharacterized protein n=1 Tax=Prorocentrum cordatum TaxID=2364126 RepID=A0ABN9PT04_9DINO|nr:unnamed protein product [Polarella glacialis]
MVAAAGCTVACGVAQQPQDAAAGTPGTSAAARALRRARQLAARHADAGRLQAALHRVEELEVELQNLQSAVRAMMLQAVEQVATVLPTEKEPSPPPEAHPGAQTSLWVHALPGATVSAAPSPEAEVTDRLALMAPVVKAVLTNSRADSITVRRRNAAGHCWGAPARAIRRMGRASLNRLQRSGGGSGTKARQRPARRFDLAQRARLAEVAVQRTMKGMFLGMPLTLPVVAARSWRVTLVRLELPPSGSSGEIPKKVAMRVMTVVLNTAALVLGWFAMRLSSPLVTLKGFLPMFVDVEPLEVWLFPVSVRPHLRPRSMLKPPTSTTSMVVAVVQCTVAQVPRLAAANITMLFGTLVEFLVFFWQGLALQMPLWRRARRTSRFPSTSAPPPAPRWPAATASPTRSTSGGLRVGALQRHFVQTVGTERFGGKPFEVWVQEREAEHRAQILEIRCAHRDGLVAKLRLKARRK